MKKLIYIILLLYCGCARNYDEPLKILVTKNESLNQEELWLMDIDGRHEIQLTSFASENRCTYGSWSQDGSHIIYLQSNGAAFCYLMIMDSDGKNKKLVATDAIGYNSVSFFVDNKRIAVSLNSPVSPYLFLIINIDTGETTTLSTTQFPISRLSVSPDGTIMISEPSTDGGYQLWNEKAGLSSLIVPAGTLTFSNFSWDSEGKISAVYDSVFKLYLYDHAAQTTTPVTATLTAETTVSWDPLNEYIYFSSPSGIQKIKPDGTDFQTINSNPLYTQPQVQFKTK